MKTIKSLTKSIIGILLAMGLVAGCTTAAKEESKEAKEQIKEDLSEAKKELAQELNKAIAEVDQEIAKLKTESQEATADVRQQLDAAISGLIRERQKVVDQVRKVGEASETSWKDIQQESQKAMKSASDAYENLSDNIKELLKQ